MKARTAFVGLIALALFSVPAIGHHSISGEFDSRKLVTLTGTISNVDWMNPHTYVFVDAKDPALGKIRTWACELLSPKDLFNRGFTRESLKVGMSVQIKGSRAKDGSFKLHAETLTANNTVLLGK